MTDAVPDKTPQQRADLLRINPHDHRVPLPTAEPGSRTQDGEPVAVRFIAAAYSDTPEADVTAVAVAADEGDVRLYPLPDGEPHAMFDGQEWLPISRTELPAHVADALRPDINPHNGFLVDTDHADDDTVYRQAVLLYDLPFTLVRFGGATVLARLAGGVALAWPTAHAFLRLGLTAPLGLVTDLSGFDQRPDLGIPTGDAEAIRRGLLRAIEETQTGLVKARNGLYRQLGW